MILVLLSLMRRNYKTQSLKEKTSTIPFVIDRKKPHLT